MDAEFWFLDGENNQHGPVPKDEIIKKFRDGTIRPESHVWTSGMAEWGRLDTIPAFSSLVQPSKTPPPAPPVLKKGEPKRKAPLGISVRIRPWRDILRSFVSRILWRAAIFVAVIIAAVIYFLLKDRYFHDPEFAKSTASEPSPKTVAKSDGWFYKETTDKLTGDTSNILQRDAILEHGGHAHMAVSCRELNIFFRKYTFLGILVDFFDQDETGLNVDNTGFNDNNVGTFRYSATTGKDGKIDAALLRPNEAQIRVWKHFTLLGDDKIDVFKFADATSFKVEIPLVDGEMFVVDLLPQDTNIKDAFKDCTPSPD